MSAPHLYTQAGPPYLMVLVTLCLCKCGNKGLACNLNILKFSSAFLWATSLQYTATQESIQTPSLHHTHIWLRCTFLLINLSLVDRETCPKVTIAVAGCFGSQSCDVRASDLSWRTSLFDCGHSSNHSNSWAWLMNCCWGVFIWQLLSSLQRRVQFYSRSVPVYPHFFCFTVIKATVLLNSKF